ncbi:DsbA family protein [Polynucleobacter brandtiae]|uniref:Putative DsbA family dithiol-disulfide isomerase n=1 Tax=Polynucleobacter brandtiae TaxID=1938816 RepID=A0A2M8VZT0_9BURK|nr:DsbA family protein [Polynucleobacter brandtiae]PJI83371.1 putative DsbA family dithiol-disulfide isomerase [Polynucleobacter brandtiae]
MIQIQIWGDFECPYSYLQTLALMKLTKHYSNQIEVLWRAPELNTSRENAAPSKSYVENLTIALAEPIAQENTLTLNAPVLLKDTWLAQESACYANQQGLSLPFALAVFEAVFSKAVDISIEEEILEIAAQVNMNAERLRDGLNSGILTKQTLLDADEFKTYGFQGVPAMLIGEKNFSPRSFSPITGYTTFEELVELIPANSLIGNK